MTMISLSQAGPAIQTHREEHIVFAILSAFVIILVLHPPARVHTSVSCATGSQKPTPHVAAMHVMVDLHAIKNTRGLGYPDSVSLFRPRRD